MVRLHQFTAINTDSWVFCSLRISRLKRWISNKATIIYLPLRESSDLQSLATTRIIKLTISAKFSNSWSSFQSKESSERRGIVRSLIKTTRFKLNKTNSTLLKGLFNKKSKRTAMTNHPWDRRRSSRRKVRPLQLKYLRQICNSRRMTFWSSPL